MAGFSGNAQGADVVFADNVDFTGVSPAKDTITTNGQLIIGSTALNAGGTHINIGELTSPDASIVIGYASPNITLRAAAGATDLHTARFIVSPGGAADGANFTQIQVAMDAAQAIGGRQTVFVQPSTYNENLTFHANVNLCAYNTDSGGFVTGGAVTVVGTHTATFAGSISISGIRFQTNANYIMQVTGVAATVITWINCYFDATNFSAFNMTSSGAPRMYYYQCEGDLGVVATSWFTVTQNGRIACFYCDLFNNAGSTASSTWSNTSDVTMIWCRFPNAITLNNTTNSGFGWSSLSTLVINSTGSHSADSCNIGSAGVVAAITVAVGCTMIITNCNLASATANIVTGAGTLRYGNVLFNGTGTNFTVTTQETVVTTNDRIKVTIPGAYPYTVLTQDAMVPVDTSAARTVNLPATPASGEQHIIKDNTGTAAANNITVQGNGNNIDGAASRTMNVNFGSLKVIYNGTQWNVV